MKRLTTATLTLAALLALLLIAREPTPAQSSQPKNRVEITIRGNERLIDSNGIPDHPTGQFPNRNNPNSIREQNHHFRVPLNPKPARRITSFGLGKFGVAVNGVPFDPGAAEFWNRDRNSGWQYDAMSGAINLGLDSSHAHVQPTGDYHYHGIPTALVTRLSGGKKNPVLLGYAGDGFPIYSQFGYSDPNDKSSEVRELKSSYRIKKGNRPNGPRGRYDGSFVEDYEYVDGSGDLDECNGREGIMPEYPDGTYYYVLTNQFPFIPRKFRGTPHETFTRRGPPGGGPPGGGPPGGGPPGGRPGPAGPPLRRSGERRA